MNVEGSSPLWRFAAMKRIFYLSGTLLFLLLLPAIAQGQITPSFLGEWSVGAPEDVDVDGIGNVYVATGRTVRKYSSDGVLQWESINLGTNVQGVAVLGDSVVYATGNTGYKLSADTGVFLDNFPIGLCCSKIHVSGDGIYLSINASVTRRDLEGTVLSEWGANGTGPGFFQAARGITQDNSGNILVVDSGNDRIQQFTTDGTFIKEAAVPQLLADSPGAYGIAVDPTTGWVFVTDNSLHRIYLFDSDLNYIDFIGTHPASFPGFFTSPRGVVVTQTGVFYIADTSNHRIQYFSLGALQVPTRKTTWGRIKTLYGSEGDTE